MALLLLVLLTPQLLVCSTIVIDFDSFMDGDAVTSQIPGFLFTNTTVLTAGVSLNEFEFPPHSDFNVVSDSGGPITINFAAPVLSFGGYFTYLQPLSLAAFGDASNPVGAAASLFANNLALSGDSGSTPNELLQVIFAGGISSVVITGDPVGGSFTLDDVTVTTADTAVPEPSSLFLILAGLIATLAGCGFTPDGVRWRRRIPCRAHAFAVLLGLTAASSAALAQDVGPPGVFPAAININSPTTIMITSLITAANVVPGGVNVQRLNSSGQVQSVLGLLHDDGHDPDLIAGDGVYSGTVILNESQTGSIGLRVSAAIRGVLLRMVSDTVAVDILPFGIPTDTLAPDLSHVATDPNTGILIVSNEALACFAETTSIPTVIAIGALFNGTIVGRFSGLGNCYQFGLPSTAAGAAAVQSAIVTLKSRPEVIFAGPDTVTTVFQAPVCTNLPTCIDPGNAHYNHLQLNAGHAISTGAGVTVVVLDTEVDTKNTVLSPHLFPIPRDDVGRRFAGPTVGITPDFGHGTMVAGVIAATAPSSKIYPIRLLNEQGQTSGAMFASAIRWAARVAPRSIINISAGFYDKDQLDEFLPLLNAIVYARSRKCVIVAASGNAKQSQPRAFPAGINALSLLSVGATNKNDVRASPSDWGPNFGSNFGNWVQIAAPGTCIPSTFLDGYTVTPPSFGCLGSPVGEFINSGTSFAAPFVAGAAALVRSLHPTWTADQVVQQLKDTAKPINPINAPDPSYNQQLGSGLVDPLAALYNCTATFTAKITEEQATGPGFPPLPADVGLGAIYEGILRYNSTSPPLFATSTNARWGSFGSFTLYASAGSHTWKGQTSDISTQATQYAFRTGSFPSPTHLSSDGQYRLYDSYWQFQGAPYPIALLTDPTPWRNSSLVKLFEAHLSAPGVTNAAFSSYLVAGNILTIALSCGP